MQTVFLPGIDFVDDRRIFADHFQIPSQQSAAGTPFGIGAHAAEIFVGDDPFDQRRCFRKFHIKRTVVALTENAFGFAVAGERTLESFDIAPQFNAALIKEFTDFGVPFR